ncbi:hypothetical protein RA993_22950, partial [Mycobacteroides abscessus subsp. abscessus]
DANAALDGARHILIERAAEDAELVEHAPNYGEAKNRLQRAEQAVMVANANARQLRESFTNRQARPSTIPHLRERDPDK